MTIAVTLAQPSAKEERPKKLSLIRSLEHQKLILRGENPFERSEQQAKKDKAHRKQISKSVKVKRKEG